MIEYTLIEDNLNIEAKKILLLIKDDYYEFMSDKKKQEMDRLIECQKIVEVNRGKSKFNDNTIAHGGRALKDGKIHFYPDTRNFKTNEEVLEKCYKILPHELFHFFLQPDFMRFENKKEKEMASFYTEGLVEKETRIFCEKHPEVPFEKANYGYNVNFVNMIQGSLGATSYEKLFSEDRYLTKIRRYGSAYSKIIKEQDEAIKAIDEISEEFPDNLKISFRKKSKRMILQDGNTKAVKEKIELLGFVSKNSIEKLKTTEELEL